MDLPIKYPPEHYRKKSEHYGITLRVIFGVKVDEVTKNRWCDLIAFARGIDTYLDEGPRESLGERTADVGLLLDHPSEVASQFPYLSVDQLGLDTYDRLAYLGHSILRVNRYIKNTTDMRRYAPLRRKEGRNYAELITSVATPEVSLQPGYERFSRWLLPTGEVTNLLNSWRQIHQDFARGEIALQPNHLTRLQLLGHVALALTPH